MMHYNNLQQFQNTKNARTENDQADVWIAAGSQFVNINEKKVFVEIAIHVFMGDIAIDVKNVAPPSTFATTAKPVQNVKYVEKVVFVNTTNNDIIAKIAKEVYFAFTVKGKTRAKNVEENHCANTVELSLGVNLAEGATFAHMAD